MRTGTIIHGTHRHQELIPCLFMELRERDQNAYKHLLKRYADAPCIADCLAEDSDWWDSVEASWLLEDLFDALDNAAPDGFYFGAHTGDGSDFGFWEIEE